MSLVVGLDQRQGSSLAVVGGKGYNLINLASAGFPVPPGFVVTAEAYRLFAESAPWLVEAVDEFDYEAPERLRDQCTAVRARLAEVALPSDVAEAVREAFRRLGDVESVAFAVRSSSTLEDLAQAAFAGQHDTYLNVRGTENLFDKIRDCFVSLWGDRAVLYRHRQGFSQRQSHMAVVVQQQVFCDRAGVGFSIHPVTGQLGRLVIDANYGLGESVVSGECEVDHFELDKGNLEIVVRSIGHKDRMIAPTGDGVEERAVAAPDVDRPCLSDEEIRTVSQLLKRVEAHYGWPQDIEWGFQGGQLFLLQSRAVTTIQPRYTRDESAERFPNPMTPLTWDFLSDVFRQSLAHSLNLMGLPPLQEDWFKTFDHYVYGNQNAVELLTSYRPMRSTSLRELDREIPDLRRRYAWVSDLPVHWARDLDRYLLRLGRLSAVPLEGLSTEQLWQHILDIQQAATDYFLPNIAISITQSFLHRLLFGLVAMVVGRDRALEVLDGLMAACETKTAVVNRELHELAQVAAGNDALRQELVERGGKAFWDAARTGEYAEFAQRLQRFLEDHGHREMDMDYSQPTWSAAPWVVLDNITLMLRQPSQEDPAATARHMRLKYSEMEHEFLSTVPEDLRFFYRELIRLARAYTALDDLEHYQTTRVNPLARQAAMALGRRMVEQGILDDPADLFFFRREDLGQLMANFPPADKTPYRDMVYQAKQSYEVARNTTPPWSLTEPAADPDPDPASTDVLRGLPGSPGNVTASCFVVHGPDDFGRFPPGAVLVARTTNPAWTPLFYSAAGLITESGGPLSHGAVTAREMRLPAVMSVRSAMSLLQSGQEVTVDGTQGLVLLKTD